MSAESLGGARVALLEARMESELAALVTRLGGVPVSVPAVREAPLDSRRAAGALLAALEDRRADVIVFLTGVGARLVFEGAAQLGRLEALCEELSLATVVCRGPKPAAALREQQLRAQVHAASPFTTTDILTAMAPLALEGRGVAIVEYGEPNVPLADALRRRGATVESLQVYAWQPPADVAPLAALVDDVIRGRVDAVAFTSQVQARHFVAAAELLGRREALVRALGNAVVTVSIGPTCTAALEAAGIAPHVTADPPKMRPMLSALAEFLARRTPSSTASTS